MRVRCYCSLGLHELNEERYLQGESGVFVSGSVVGCFSR